MMTTEEICIGAEGLILAAGDSERQIKAAVALLGIAVRALKHFGGPVPTLGILMRHVRNLEHEASPHAPGHA